MKKILNAVFALAIIGLMMTSCQNDSDSEKLSKNSTLTQLLMRVTHNGTSPTGRSGDDDDACFVVNLPVSLLVDGQTVTVTTMDEYAIVLNALHHCGDSDDDGDDDDDSDDHVTATFVFPINITFADGTTQVITTDEELNVAVHSCSDDADDIECLDLHYPLTLTFTDANNVSTVITLNNDDETYTFLATLGTSETVVINYPLTITDASGETEVVNSNDELLDEIQEADDDCGHHDGDDDGDDDDEDDDDDDQGEDDKR